MKKTLLSLMLMAVSAPTLAIQNGIPESPDNFPSLVTMNCTGTIIAGNWVMTAKHCNEQSVTLVGAKGQHGASVVAVTKQEKHGDADFALWQLNDIPQVDKSLFLSTEFVTNDKAQVFNIYGFGQTGTQLNSAQYQIHGNYNSPEILDLDPTGVSQVVHGDSGSSIVDSKDKIVAITTRANVGTDGKVASVRMTYVSDFILSTINAWHHPTIGSVAAGQSTTIEVQSLHANPVTDTAFRTGDIEIDVANSSCMTGQVQPFDICTYTVSSKNGYEGVLTLEDGHTVTFNKGKSEVITPPTPEPAPDSSGGGALGFLGLLALGLVTLRRQFAR